jgi:hypothetical protein
MACGDIDWAMFSTSSGSKVGATPRYSNTREGDGHYIAIHTHQICPLMILWDRLTLHLRHTQVTDYQLLAAIQAFTSDLDSVRVQEFTTVLDDRALLPTLGFFIELAGPLGALALLAYNMMDERPLTNPIVR